MRFLMLVISLAVMGSISQSKTYRGNHRGRSPRKSPPRKSPRKSPEGHRGRFFKRWWGKNQDFMQMRFLMLVISLAVMGSISQSKTYHCGNHRGRSPYGRSPRKSPRRRFFKRWWGKNQDFMQMRFLMLVISLAVMGSISQSKTYHGNHRRRSPKSPQKVTAEITAEGHRGNHCTEGHRGRFFKRWWGKN